MRIATLLLLITASLAEAAPTRVAVIDGEKLYDTGGIAKWLAARAKLDAERKSFKVVEKPAGQPTPALPDWCGKPKTDWERDTCKKLRETLMQHVEGSEWEKHEHEVLDPIEADVQKELQRYAASSGIDILLDRSELGESTVLFVSPQTDITSAFIKSYNAKKK